MKHLLTLTLVLCLVASGAVAAKLPAKSAPKGDLRPYLAAKVDLTEDFEGVFPPADWVLDTTNDSYTWQTYGSLPYSGLSSALVPWQSRDAQDEALSFSWAVDVGADLFFATKGSPLWSSNANFTVTIDGTEVYNFDLDNGGVPWVWEEVQIDLASYEGTTPTFTFRYAGSDGADQLLDAVHIGSFTPPPPTDVGFCELVVQETGTTFTGSTCEGPNLLTNLGCSNYSEYGRESYFAIEVPMGCFFDITVTSTADAALWLLDDCVATGGAFSCLGFADETFADQAEVISYTNTSAGDQVVYLVIDAYGADACGEYLFDFESDCAVAEEGTSFGSLKAMFR